MTPRCLYLVSSSASREYVADCLEALALPRQMVHHFRYRISYIDERLRISLRSRPGRLPPGLQNLPVVVVYLYQEQAGGKWEPAATSSDGSYLPLRCGRLIEAFLEGEVAHFYFELTDYVKPKVGNVSARALLNHDIRFRINSRKKAELSYAHVAQDLKLGAPAGSDALAFQRFVANAYQPSEWRTRSLGSVPLDVTYDVVFLRIGGIFRERDNRLEPVRPVRRELVGNPSSEYELELGSTYHIQVATRLRARLPAELPGQGSAMLRLGFDPNIFRPAGPTGFRISSTYDLHYWSIVPAGSPPQRAVLSIACDHNLPVDRVNFVRKELLCPELSLLVSIGVPVSKRSRS
jgi:hypothetical protein